MSVKLLIEHHLEFISLKGGCTGSSESTLVKMPHCWKTRVTAHMTTFSGQKIVAGIRVKPTADNSNEMSILISSFKRSRKIAQLQL